MRRRIHAVSIYMLTKYVTNLWTHFFVSYCKVS